MNSTCELGRHAARALKPYPAYKDSRIEWLEEVPEHWKTERAKWLFRKMEQPVRENDEVVTCFRDGVVTLRKNRRVRGFTESLKEIGYQGVRRGDLVIHAMDAFAGAIGVSDSDGKGTPVYSVCSPRQSANAYYYAFCVREMARSEWILALAKGIRERSTDFRFKDFASQWVPLPPLPEQAAIVRFLDHADRRIRRYIRAKQKLIALLEEQKQAIIHQAVTGQINVRTGQPYPAYKPSGVEWLGDVPAHWQVRRLRYLIKGRLTYGANAAAEHTDPAWPRYLRITDFSKNGTLRKDTFRSLPPQTAKDYLVEPGDVLLARSGATVGKAFLVEEAAGVACHAGYLIRVRLNRSILHPAFFFAFTQSAAFAMWKDATFIIATIQNIGADRYADLSVPVPPISEQELLLRFLDESTADIDRAVERAEVEMALLREYRTRLIADVVTGKLDVREAAARLPDEVEKLEPLDEADALIDGEEEPTDALATVP